MELDSMAIFSIAGTLHHSNDCRSTVEYVFYYLLADGLDMII
ncbi:hypothetical protein NRY68_15360 [Acidithiobacillus ferrooxidans]|nr:hypothetical protein [Acidithiobacillus ferrooxidans]MCR1347136.1 hypothetical protein [Acidithiobacillus ferrooxidans]MCR1356674.1 hypothetical protein [Acidithiobacillus ferrooxidans]